MSQSAMIDVRPLPAVTELTEPYWSAARQRELVLQHCGDCEKPQFPPEVSCTHCGSASLSWERASGRARLYSWTIAHPPLLPYFAARAPWPVSAVELEEGVRLVTQIVGLEVEDYVFDMPLIADFEPVDDEVTLVVFRPAESD